MVSIGRIADLSTHGYVVLVPGIFLFLTVFGLNRVGERARLAWSG